MPERVRIESPGLNVNGCVLVLFPGALGDFVCFYPTLEFLAARSVRTRLLLRDALGDLLPDQESRLQVRSLDRPEVNRLFVEGAGTEPEVQSFLGCYDRIYSWTGREEPVFSDNLCAATRGELHLFPFRPGAGWEGARRTEYYLACAGAGLDSLRRARMPLKSAAVQWAAELWAGRRLAGRAVLAVAPGSGAARKNWRLERFMTVCRWWNRTTGGVSLVILGPVEEERMPESRSCFDGVLVLRGLSLSRLAAVLAKCDAYVGNDSGPSHLAAALGVPTVVVFRVTDAREWMPWGPRVTVIGPEPPTDRDGEFRRGERVGDVSADSVIRELVPVARGLRT